MPAIHEMTAINQMAKWNNRSIITFHSRVIGLSCCENDLTGACPSIKQKMFRKYRQILATAMESISRKGSFLKLVNKFWKGTLPQLFFYIAILISSKFWKFPVHSLIRRDFSFSAFLFIDQERFFLFLWIFLMKGAVVQHMIYVLYHVKKCSVRFVQEVVKYVWKIHY